MTRVTEIIERASSGAYGEDSGDIAKVFGWLAAIKFDEDAGPFICGTVGKQGGDGLHGGYMVCPTYGADANCTAIFMRASK